MTVSVDGLKMWTGGVSADGHQQYDVVVQARATDAADGPHLVLVATLNWLPPTYQFGNDSNPYALLHTVGNAKLVNEEEYFKLWRVPATYSTKSLLQSSNPKNLIGDPITTIPWEIGGSYTQNTRYTDRDRFDNVMTNSAGEPREDEKPENIDTLTLEGPSYRISLSTRAQAIGKVNSAAIWGLSPRMLKLKQWTYKVRWIGAGDSYAWNSLHFEIKYSLWNFVYTDVGYREYFGIGPDGKPVYAQILTDNDIPVSRPVALNGSGLRLDISTQPQGFKFSKEVLDEYDFLTLGFPNPLPGPFI